MKTKSFVTKYCRIIVAIAGSNVFRRVGPGAPTKYPPLTTEQPTEKTTYLVT